MGAHTPQEVMDLQAFWFAFRLLRSWDSWGAGRGGRRLDASVRRGWPTVTAWVVHNHMGHIGRRKPKVRSHDEQDAGPFDDAIPF